MEVDSRCPDVKMYQLDSTKQKPLKDILNAYQQERNFLPDDFEIKTREKSFPVSKIMIQSSTEFLSGQTLGLIIKRSLVKSYYLYVIIDIANSIIQSVLKSVESKNEHGWFG